MKQHTIQSEITISGSCLHSGKPSKLKISPAPENTGIVFINNHEIIPASACYLIDDIHTTTLMKANKRIGSIEHLLSTFTGLGIDNAYVTLLGEEIPIINNLTNSEYYTKSILDAGIVEQSEDITPIIIKDVIILKSGRSHAILSPCKNQNLEISLSIEFPQPIGKQQIRYTNSADKYLNEIAWARSFLYKDIYSQNDGMSYWEVVRERIKILPANPYDSPIPCFSNNEWLSSPTKHDEPVRHKLLDLLGDLFLVGGRIFGEIKIFYPGHNFNHKLTKFLLDHTLFNK